MSSELVSRLEDRTAHPTVRPLAIRAVGPLTMLGGVVWAVTQPSRLAVLHPTGDGLYDWLVEPALLVVVVGVLFAAVIAPGIVDDLRSDR